MKPSEMLDLFIENNHDVLPIHKVVDLCGIQSKFSQLEEDILNSRTENEMLREFVELTQSQWEEFGCDDGIVTVKYPWAIQERMREIAALTAEESE